MSLKRKLSQKTELLYETAITFFSAAPGSLKNHLNVAELERIAIASVCAGTGVYGFLDGLLKHVGLVFPAPIDAALATIVLTLIMEVRRRLEHGVDLSPSFRKMRSSL